MIGGFGVGENCHVWMEEGGVGGGCASPVSQNTHDSCFELSLIVIRVQGE